MAANAASIAARSCAASSCRRALATSSFRLRAFPSRMAWSTASSSSAGMASVVRTVLAATASPLSMPSLMSYLMIALSSRRCPAPTLLASIEQERTGRLAGARGEQLDGVGVRVEDVRRSLSPGGVPSGLGPECRRYLRQAAAKRRRGGGREAAQRDGDEELRRLAAHGH